LALEHISHLALGRVAEIDLAPLSMVDPQLNRPCTDNLTSASRRVNRV
jgi:hypothetical protein